jgi:hypothetical protein
VTVQWTPPAGATARVAILATVVQTKLTFWTDVAAYTDAGMNKQNHCAMIFRLPD